MGPFSNNTPPPPPRFGDNNKLPTPDVAAPQQAVVVEAPVDQTKAVKKWFVISMWIASGMAVVALLVFIVFVIISNTPSYMLATATRQLITEGGTAGNFSYETRGKRGASTTNGDFVLYGDPTDPQKSSMTISAGQGGSRVNAVLLLTGNTDYLQTAGLDNLKRLLEGMRIDNSNVTADGLVQLSSLDGQWYSLTNDDTPALSDVVEQHTIKDALSPGDISTLASLYEKNQFLNIREQYGDEQVNTITSMHLRVGIDGPKFVAFIRSVKAANLKSISVTDADIANLSHLPIDSYDIEVWISRSDKTFQQWRITSNQPNDTAATTINFKPETVATTRQAVQRPDNVRSISVFTTGLRDNVFGGQPVR